MSETNPVHPALSEAVDRLLLDLIQNGREVLDTNGLPILDSDGKPLRKKATAADIAQARGRLKDVGSLEPSSALDNLRRAVDNGSLKLTPLPPIDDEPDAATGTHG